MRIVSVKYQLKYRFGFDENKYIKEEPLKMPDLQVDWLGKSDIR